MDAVPILAHARAPGNPQFIFDCAARRIRVLDWRPMRPNPTLLLALVLFACGGGTESTGDSLTTTDGGGQCGDVSDHNILIRAKVVEQDGVTPVAGAELRIIEDVWHFPERIYGFAITDSTGVGEFTANGIVSVEDCWGVSLNYGLYAQLGDRTASDPSFNSSLFNAINSETWVSDTTGFPLVMAP